MDRIFGGDILRWIVKTFPEDNSSMAAANKLVMEGFPPPQPRHKKKPVIRLAPKPKPPAKKKAVAKQAPAKAKKVAKKAPVKKKPVAIKTAKKKSKKKRR